jgi:hypothetical protein
MTAMSSPSLPHRSVHGVCDGDAIRFTWDGNDEMEVAGGHGRTDGGSSEGASKTDISFIARHFFNSLLVVTGALLAVRENRQPQAPKVTPEQRASCGGIGISSRPRGPATEVARFV